MAEGISVWYDPEADYLEVIFDNRAGTFRETPVDQVMAKVDAEGQVIGFSILRVSSLKHEPVAISLSGG